MTLRDEINNLPAAVGEGSAGHLGNHRVIHEALKVHDADIQAAMTSADTASTTARDVEARVSSVEAMAGLSPESPTDGQTASLISQTGTLTSAAVTGKIESHVSDRVSSPAVARILASSDPNTPLNEGDLLLLYAPALSIFQSFSTMDGLTSRWAGGDWSIVTDKTADGGNALQVTGTFGRRLVSLDEADGMRDMEIVSRMKMSVPVVAGYGAGVAVRGSGEAGAENGYLALATTEGLKLSKYVNGTFSLLGDADAPTTRNGWYWIRLRVEGMTISASMWTDGESEPADWMLVVTDSAVKGGGWAGPTTSTNSSNQSWDVIGISELDTGEEKAPVSA